MEPNTYEIDGAMNIDEANDELGLNIPEGDYETIAGFILENFQKMKILPKKFLLILGLILKPLLINLRC